VLDLVDAGRPVVDVAHDLGISAQSTYSWRRQDRMDKGREPGLSSAEKAELTVCGWRSHARSRGWRTTSC
jgi:transposase-like protein